MNLDCMLPQKIPTLVEEDLLQSWMCMCAQEWRRERGSGVHKLVCVQVSSEW